MPIATADTQADQDPFGTCINNPDIWEEFFGQLEACRAALTKLKDGMQAVLILVKEMESFASHLETRLDTMDSIATARFLSDDDSEHDSTGTAFVN